MMRGRPTRDLLAACVLSLAFLCEPAVSGDTEARWDEGLAAYGQGDYRNALAAFRSAREAGYSGPSVHYNIAVCEFQLGQFEAADRTFTFIASNFPAMEALAEYNRGLIAEETSHRRAARAHFLRAYELSGNDEKVRILAATMLDRTGLPEQSMPAWTAIVTSNLGYDDNVILRDDFGLAADTSAESAFADLYASARVAIPAIAGLHLDASAYLVWYADAHDFEQSQSRAGMGYDTRAGAWDIRAGAAVSYGRFGGRSFDEALNLEAQLARSLSGLSSVTFRFRHSDIDARDPLYPGIEGDRQQFDVRYRWQSGRHRVDVNVGHESNSRVDAEISPDRNLFGLLYENELDGSWSARFAARYRNSDYRAGTVDRSEDLTTVRAELHRNIGDSWRVIIQLRSDNNESTEPLLSYDRNVLSVGIVRSFQN